ncbi:MAG: hypothetical protein K6F09_01270 [Clostridiales bacterium]|nr:hypothetical protein [Clostridiales bacterium]
MKSYFDRVHVWGRIWTVSALCVIICVPLLFCIHYNSWPPFSGVIKGILAVIPLYWASAVVEVLSYAPLLGAGGTYLSFVTGNITNLKLPCSIAAMDSAEVRPNTEEGEVITTIAVATSSIVTTVIIALGVLVFRPFLHFVTDDSSVFAPAFQQVLPAIFGAIGASYFMKHWKISFVPIIIGVLVLVFVPTLQIGILILITIVASLVGAQIMYKKGIA